MPPNFSTGDMLDPTNWRQAHLSLVTASATLNRANRLMMERGQGRRVRERWPGIEKGLGEEVKAETWGFKRFKHEEKDYRVFNPPYRLLISPHWPKRKLGLFQVSRRFCNDAELLLIEYGVALVRQFCVGYPGVRIHLEFPGAGDGGLRREWVLPLVERLPDNVTIWELPHSSSVVTKTAGLAGALVTTADHHSRRNGR